MDGMDSTCTYVYNIYGVHTGIRHQFVNTRLGTWKGSNFNTSLPKQKPHMLSDVAAPLWHLLGPGVRGLGSCVNANACHTPD